MSFYGGQVAERCRKCAVDGTFGRGHRRQLKVRSSAVVLPARKRLLKHGNAVGEPVETRTSVDLLQDQSAIGRQLLTNHQASRAATLSVCAFPASRAEDQAEVRRAAGHGDGRRA